jgi:hypothetical protein
MGLCQPQSEAAALTMTSATASGCDSIGTCELSKTSVSAPIRLAESRSASGGMVCSFVATMYQLAFDRHAAALNLVAEAPPGQRTLRGLVGICS